MGFRKWSREVMVFLLFVFVLVVLGKVEAFGDEELGRIVYFKSGRILVDDGNISESVLTHRTERVDPLDDLKRYKGGFNITNKHYWGSVIFTGKFGYIIGVAWLVGGLIYAVILIASSLCFNKHGRLERRRPKSMKNGYNWSLLLVILLTLLAIIASGVALGASSKFHSRAVIIKKVVVSATNNASTTIYTVTEAVENLRNDTLLSRNVEDSSKIASALKKLNEDTRRIQRKAERIMHWVSKGLNILNVVTIVTISLNLVAILVLLGVLRLGRVVRMLIILCWLLIILLWVYFGLYYFFGKFAGDICLALDEYKQNPERSTLSSILPCNDRGSAATVLRDVSVRVYDIIQQVNANITSLKPSISELKYICNPFSGPPEYNYQPGNCSSDTITVGQVPQLVENFACTERNNGGCQPGQFIPAHVYDKLENYTNSVQDILDSYPVMKSLINCQLVKEAFSNILFYHCQPLKKYVHMSWASLAALSTVMAFLILICESKARRDGKFRSSDGSVKPSLMSVESTEEDDANEIVCSDVKHKVVP